jgi:hypothetical protein
MADTGERFRGHETNERFLTPTRQRSTYGAYGTGNFMGLSTPATKVWEIPEPKPAYAPEPEPKERKPEPAPAKKEREKELVPA